MNDIEILARTLYGEARFGDAEDAEAIANVVLNRVGYRNWPSTIGEVCLQPWQFSCWLQHDDAHAANFRRLMAAERGSNKWFDRCWTIAELATTGALTDRTRTSTHYHTRAVAPKWSKGKTPTYETPAHVYFNNIDTPAPTTAADALEVERPIKDTRTIISAATAALATVAGAIYESAQEVIGEATSAVAPLSGIVGEGTIRTLLFGIALGGILAVVYARLDDRRKGLR